jgi:hypothetical protein
MKKLVIFTLAVLSLSLTSAFALPNMNGAVIGVPPSGGGGGGGTPPSPPVLPLNPDIGEIDTRMDPSLSHNGSTPVVANPILSLPAAGLLKAKIRPPHLVDITKPVTTGCTPPGSSATFAQKVEYRKCMALKSTGSTLTPAQVTAMKSGANSCQPGFFVAHNTTTTTSMMEACAADATTTTKYNN